MERLLRLHLDELGTGDRFEVTSAGVRAMRGRAMHPESLRTLAARDGSGEGFVARQFTDDLSRDAGLILAATRDIRSALLEESPRALRRSFTVKEFVALAEERIERDEIQAPAATDGVLAQDPRLQALVALCARERSAVKVEDFDIADPIGRSPETFDRVAVEMEAHIAHLARVLSSGF